VRRREVGEGVARFERRPSMGELEKRKKVMLLSDRYRILGTMRLGPDGTLWDFKHRPNDAFVTVFDAQVFRLEDGNRMVDAARMELCKTAIVGVFIQDDVAFVRKESQ
jgi:hypothetical protein